MKEQAANDQFLTSFLEEVIADCFQTQTGNTDHLRFPQKNIGAWGKAKGQLKERILRSASSRGFVYANGAEPAQIARRLSKIVAAQDRFGEFYQLLGDEPSRQQAIKLLAFSVLGTDRVKLPQNNPEFWRAVERVDELVAIAGTIPVAANDWKLDLFDLNPIGTPAKMHAHRLNILDTFLLEQYRYDKGGVRIAAETGDTVIDAGACWGDTALYFAHLVGAKGRVHCFEFTPANLEIFARNLDLNPELRERVDVTEKAVWDRSGEPLAYCDAGPGTSLRSGLAPNDGPVAETISIDDFVRDRALETVELIKMDIEGAEMNALHGTEQTLRRFRPKLAIALYHNWDDFITIPKYLDQLGLGYEFYLDHFTIHQEETVLFARPAGSARPSASA